MPVKTRLETDADLSIGLARYLDADSPAQSNHPLIDDAVINLYAIATLSNHPGLVERVQVLRHVGLGRVDLGQQLTHILFAVAQGADDAQAHRRRHDTKQLGGFVKNLFGFGQDVVFWWCCFGHVVFSSNVSNAAQLSCKKSRDQADAQLTAKGTATLNVSSIGIVANIAAVSNHRFVLCSYINTDKRSAALWELACFALAQASS